MATQLDLPVIWNGIKRYRSSAPMISAAALLLVGGGLLFALPGDTSTRGKETVSATPAVIQTASVETTGSAVASSSDAELDESACDKQAWPYVDQRCAQRVEQARGSRKVRIVTDKGNSVTVMTPVPVVEAKPKPAPAPAPVVAQAERKIGPTAIPPTPEGATRSETTASIAQPEKPATPPQSQKTETVAAAPPPAPAPQAATAVSAEPKPSVQTAMAPDKPAAGEARMRNPVDPVASSQAPASSFIEAIDRSRQKMEKSDRATKRDAKREAKEAKREAKRQKMMAEANGVPEEVVAAVRSAKVRRNQAVPAEVLAAVEEAAAREQGSFGRDRRGRVVYIERGW